MTWHNPVNEVKWIVRFIRDFIMAGFERRTFERELQRFLNEQEEK